jgi:ubiquinone biosynthesis monooxygenase Coq7
MRADEVGHANTGESLGAAELPAPVKGAMRLMAKVMTETAYRF